MIEEWFNKHWKQLIENIGFIFLSLVSFCVLQFAVRWYLFGKYTFRTFDYFKFVQRRRQKSRRVPDSQSLKVVPPNKKWRISNEVVSLIHSVISGVWALYACGIYPKLVLEMNTFVNETSLGLIYLSFGYILHDLIDLLINERSYRILELLFHHVIVICGFLTTLTTNLFMGVVVFGLLMELNSIFLHTRSLMNLYRQPKNSTSFKFVALLNILTFIVFRMAVSIYLLIWQLTNALTMKWHLKVITFVIIVSLFVTNSILLYRVLYADGIIAKNRRCQTAGNLDGETTINLVNENVYDNNVEKNDNDDDVNNSSSDFDDYDCADVKIQTYVPGLINHAEEEVKVNIKRPIVRRFSISAATQTSVNDFSKEDAQTTNTKSNSFTCQNINIQ